MRHVRFVFAIAFFTSGAGVLVEGCGSGTPACPAGDVCTTAGDDGGRDIGNPSDGGGGGGGDSGTLPAGCTDAGPADDNPACNECAYANCCKQIDDCANDPTCTQFDDCEAACNNDLNCLFQCQAEYGPPQTAVDVGSCAQKFCSDKCSSGFDGGADFDF